MSHFGFVAPFLPDWEWSSNLGANNWNGMTEKSKALQSSIGQGGAFKNYMAEARQILNNFDDSRYASALTRKGMIRALIQVWIEDPTLAKATVNKRTLTQLANSSAGFTRMATVAMLQLHLSYFSELDDWEADLFETSRTAVSAAVEMQKTNQKFLDVVETVRSHPDLTIQRSAPKNIAELLVDGGQTLEGLFTDLKLYGLRNENFRGLVQYAVYLHRIKVADPSVVNDFLDDFRSDGLNRSRGPDGRFFGLSLIEALTDKGDKKPSAQWIETILCIGGDPRMSYTTLWSTWWQPVSERALETMTRWLSDQDLTLFLRAIAEFGRKSNNEEILRMYPDREKFLRGLQASGLIRETRLYMGHRARSFMQAVLTPMQSRSVTRLEGQTDTSIIFVDCGDFHIVEGSHSFKLWIYPGRPVKELTDRARYSVEIDEFRNILPDLYLHSGRQVAGIRHTASPGTWQYKALQVMIRRLGADLEPYRMMTEDSYNAMRRRIGMP